MTLTLQELTGWNGPGAEQSVLGLAIDHRCVTPGFLFAAFPGAKVNGEDFIGAAIDAGAIAILARPDAKVDTSRVLHIADANPRRRMAEIAARFYGPFPKTIAAVTGTNGKTSVADMLRQIWTWVGHPAASIGTLGVNTPAGHRDLGMTTPDVLTFLETMAHIQRAGMEYAVFEASSHGLHQHRVDGLCLTAAAFTNLSRDHLDYHPSYEAYRDAKAQLFADLLPTHGTAVLWMDDPQAQFMADICVARGIRIIGVGSKAKDLLLMERRVEPDGQALKVDYQDQIQTIRLPLIGEYQAANALVAAGLAIACGEQPATVFQSLEYLAGVPGRLQHATTTPRGVPVYVDYAHTPDGLRAAIEALRPHTKGLLHVVFGCGGDRDRGKRPQMGAIATKLADRVYVTDDNPRSEAPDAIRLEIIAQAPEAQNIGDRALAIQTAMQAACAGDIILLAGKGHEQGQIIAGVVHPFDDVEVSRRLAQEVSV